MLSVGDLEKLRQAYSVGSDLRVADVLRQLGDPADDAIVDFAVEQMSRQDRNVRVLALRVLEHYRGDRALQSLLAGLRDEKRRVCAASASFISIAMPGTTRCACPAAVRSARMNLSLAGGPPKRFSPSGTRTRI